MYRAIDTDTRLLHHVTNRSNTVIIHKIHMYDEFKQQKQQKSYSDKQILKHIAAAEDCNPSLIDVSHFCFYYYFHSNYHKHISE